MSQPLPSDQSMSSLTTAGQALYDAEQKVLNLEARLKEAKKARDAIAMSSIPDLMAEMGIEEIKMTGGRKVEVKEVLSVTPKAADRPKVMEAVVEQGAGALIKTTVSVPFGRGEDEKVKALLTLLQDQGHQAKCDTKIEPSTLKKHVRERLESGLPVDQTLFGVRQFNIAKFSEGAPKEAIFEGE